MKPGTRDDITGTFHDVKGTVKDMAEHLTHNPDLQTGGQAAPITPKVQRGIDKTAEVHGEFAPDLGKE